MPTYGGGMEIFMIGIIGAMTIEVDGLRKLMTDTTDTKIGKTTFTKGMLCGKDAVVAVCGEGKVNAAMCAQAMIMEFHPDIIINSGVAGGLSKRLKITDAVIADAVVQHDMDMSPLGYAPGHICGIDGIRIECDTHAKNLLAQCVKDSNINYITGVIASGDQFINSNEKKRWLIDTFDAAACEMEGGAIGHVCKLNDTPFAVLRTISDGGDDNSHMSFPEFAALAAENSIKIMTLFTEKY